jgi:hypothetical protein
MGGSAHTCPVLKGVTYWEQGWLHTPDPFPRDGASADARNQGKKGRKARGKGQC